MTEISKDRSLILPHRVAVQRQGGGEQRHDRHGRLVFLRFTRLAHRVGGEPAGGGCAADAGIGILVEFVDRLVGGGHNQCSFVVRCVQRQVGFDLRIAEIQPGRWCRPGDPWCFHFEVDAVMAQTGGLVFFDGMLIATGFGVACEYEADGIGVFTLAWIAVVVHGDGGAGERAAGQGMVGGEFRLRFQRDRQMRPMHQVAADRMAPMHAVPAPSVRVELVEQVVAALEFAQAVRIVHPACDRLEMRCRAFRLTVDGRRGGQRIPLCEIRIEINVLNTLVEVIVASAQIAETADRLIDTDVEVSAGGHVELEVVTVFVLRHDRVCNGGSITGAGQAD